MTKSGPVLTDRVLNRTLLQRQHLLRRAPGAGLDMVEHLVGLQAQDPLPPYLSLWARVDGFDPAEISAALESRTAARLLLMRGTVHLVTPADALGLRPLVQDALDKVTRNSAFSKPAAEVPREALAAAVADTLEAGPLPVKALGEALAGEFPGYPATALANTARELTPLVQVPPRGLWKRSGGVVYAPADTWLGAEDSAEPDAAQVARRYLRAYGPARPADFTAWSGITGARAVFARIRDDLVVYRDESGRELLDLAGLPLADGDSPAPVRLLGRYDNLWLSHADRTRAAAPENRRRWMGANGGAGNTVFVDGYLEGLWSTTGSGAVEVELFRRLSRAERQQLDAEVASVEAFLAR